MIFQIRGRPAFDFAAFSKMLQTHFGSCYGLSLRMLWVFCLGFGVFCLGFGVFCLGFGVFCLGFGGCRVKGRVGA